MGSALSRRMGNFWVKGGFLRRRNNRCSGRNLAVNNEWVEYISDERTENGMRLYSQDEVEGFV